MATNKRFQARHGLDANNLTITNVANPTTDAEAVAKGFLNAKLDTQRELLNNADLDSAVVTKLHYLGTDAGYLEGLPFNVYVKPDGNILQYIPGIGYYRTKIGGTWNNWETGILESARNQSGGFAGLDSNGRLAYEQRPTVAVQTFTSSTGNLYLETEYIDFVYCSAGLTGSLTIKNDSLVRTDRQSLILELKDNGTARAIAWESNFASKYDTLPTSTIAGKWMRIALEYSSTDSKINCISVQVQP